MDTVVKRSNFITEWWRDKWIIYQASQPKEHTGIPSPKDVGVSSPRGNPGPKGDLGVSRPRGYSGITDFKGDKGGKGLE